MGLNLLRSKRIAIGFWTVTALFCLQIGFTAYAQLALPQVAEAFIRLGFPDYFRVELAWAKLLGVVLLLAPVGSRLKKWADAGFAIPSCLRSSRILRSVVAPRRGALRRAPACSGALVLFLAPPGGQMIRPAILRTLAGVATSPSSESRLDWRSRC
jgi:hypothetical protein